MPRKSQPLAPANINPFQHITPLPPPPYIDNDTPEQELVNQDAREIHTIAAFYQEGWKHLHSLKDMMDLGDATIRLSIHRRKLFNKPYGFKDSQSKKRDVVLPID